MDLGMMLLNSGMGSAMQLGAAEVQRMQMESAQLAQAQLDEILRRQMENSQRTQAQLQEMVHRQAVELAQPSHAPALLLQSKRDSA